MTPVFEIDDLGIVDVVQGKGFLTIERDEGALKFEGFTTEFPIPTPQNLSASESGATSIDLSWDAVTRGDLDYYNVYRDTSPGVDIVPGNRIATSVMTNSYGDSGLTTNTTYYYKVTAVDTDGNESAGSNEDSATPSMSTYDAALLDDWEDGVFNTTRTNFTSLDMEDPPGAPTSSLGQTVTTRPLWTKTSGTGGEGGVDVSGGELRLKNAASSPVVEAPCSQDLADGTITYDMSVQQDGGMNKPFHFGFLADSSFSEYFYFRANHDGNAYIRRVSGGSNDIIASGSWSDTHNTHVTFKVVVTPSGDITVYEDGGQILTANDSTHTSGVKVRFFSFSAMINSTYWWIDWLRIY